LIIPENLYIRLMGRHFKFRREGRDKPVLAVIPGLEGSVGKRTEDLYNLISQAVGVRLELGR
jgi:vacuolar-type H+-ATPase subunit F/Vma7